MDEEIVDNVDVVVDVVEAGVISAAVVVVAVGALVIGTDVVSDEVVVVVESVSFTFVTAVVAVSGLGPKTSFSESSLSKMSTDFEIVVVTLSTLPARSSASSNFALPTVVLLAWAVEVLVSL